MAKHKLNQKSKDNPLLERMALTVAIIEPLSTVPQIIDLYESKNAEAISLLSWLFFILASFIWLAYGIKIKNLPLVASSILWAITELILIIGIIIYS